MTQNLHKILLAFSVILTLTVAQFWSCSTGQEITPEPIDNQTEASSDESRLSSVLWFKLLTPIMPDEGQSATSLDWSDGTNWDTGNSFISYTPIVYQEPLFPFTEKVIPTTVPYLHAYTAPFTDSYAGRGPPTAFFC